MEKTFKLMDLKGERIEMAEDLPNRFCVFDIETTSRNIYEGDLTEIGAIRVENWEITGEFRTFVKLQTESHIPAPVVSVTGISDEDVENGVYFLDALKAFYEFIGDDVIVGYNSNMYDINFINIRIIENQLPLRRIYNEHFDVMLFATKKINTKGNGGKFSLEALSEMLEIEVKERHRALADCYTTFEVLKKLKDMNYNENYVNYEDYEFNVYKKKKRNEEHQKNETCARLNIRNEFFAFFDEIKNSEEKQRKNPFYGKRVVISGAFIEFDNKDRNRVLDSLGCYEKARGNVSSKTDYVIVGNAPGNDKMKKAEKFGTTILSKEKFFEMIGFKEKTVQ